MLMYPKTRNGMPTECQGNVARLTGSIVARLGIWRLGALQDVGRWFTITDAVGAIRVGDCSLILHLGRSPVILPHLLAILNLAFTCLVCKL